ncbi:hypothetical protein E2C01_048429 [Portunus trituberculatus]|uniref:Uncharacterized protein n=2 Tax=Portunus trituberculatus TaxID=210409 RepID=A0A5B7GA76_PORTR|nr:hypothetical protein [Portunus trituberculatus]
MLLVGDAPERTETFKDTLVNYLFKVKVQDTHRLVLMDDHEFADIPPAVRVFEFHQREGDVLPFNLAAVEVASLGGVGSAQRDVRVLHALEDFLSHHFGTTRVDAITLVVPGADEPLHVLINAYHLLGLCFQDVASLMQVVVTDSASSTAQLACLKEYNIKYRNVFVFDGYQANSTSATNEEYFFAQIFCHFDFHGVDDFFHEMQDIPPQSMELTRMMDDGGVDVADLARMRVVRQYTEVVGVTHRTLSLRQLLLQVRHRDEATKTQHLVLGEPSNKASKVMVLVGSKGSGKTTLLTAVINHLLRVKYDDRFRFIVDGDPLQRLDNCHKPHKTRFTTAYTFTAVPQPYHKYNLTIIDTPGLRGPEEHTHNKQVAARVAALRDQCGIHHLDVIGLVAVAGTDRLPDTYKSVYKNIISLLTNEGKEKLFLLATRSDAKKSTVGGELRRLGLPLTKTIRFNSHSVLVDTLDRDEDDVTHEALSELYWRMEEHSLQCLLANLLI